MEDWHFTLTFIQDMPKVIIHTRVALVQGCEVLEEFDI